MDSSEEEGDSYDECVYCTLVLMEKKRPIDFYVFSAGSDTSSSRPTSSSGRGSRLRSRTPKSSQGSDLNLDGSEEERDEEDEDEKNEDKSEIESSDEDDYLSNDSDEHGIFDTDSEDYSDDGDDVIIESTKEILSTSTLVRIVKSHHLNQAFRICSLWLVLNASKKLVILYVAQSNLTGSCNLVASSRKRERRPRSSGFAWPSCSRPFH